MISTLEKFGNIPIDNTMLYEVIGNYNFPRNKVASMEKAGEIIRLKNGLYVVSPKISRRNISKELIANHLYGPSYVSFETALSFYGLIPERVYVIRSATSKRAKQFENSIGRFEYIPVPLNYYPIGINQLTIQNQYTNKAEYTFLTASPEKALCDMILSISNLQINSVKAMQIFLEDDLRIELSSLQNANTEIIRQCIGTGRKKKKLNLLLQTIENFQD